MKKKIKIQAVVLGIIIVSVLITGVRLSSKTGLVVSEKNGELSPEPVKIFRTSDKKLSIEDILERCKKGVIRFADADKDNYGFTTDVFWIHVSLDAGVEESGVSFLELQYPLVDSVELFTVRKGKVVDSQYIGDSIPYSKRHYPHKTPIFRIMKEFSAPADLYMKLETRGTMRFPLKLWSVKEFVTEKNRYNMLYGAYYGILLMLAFFITVISLNHHLKSYLFFAVFIISAGVFSGLQEGIIFEYLMPDSTTWKFSLYIASGTAGLMAISAFVYNFLNLKKASSCFRWAFAAIITAGVVINTAALIIDISTALKLFAGYGIVCLVPNLMAGISATIKRERPGRYFLAAMIIFLLAITVFALRGFGVLPVNVVTLYSKEIGIILMVMTLTFGVADIFNKYRIQSITDSLTGIINLRRFYEIAANEIERSRRSSVPLSVAMIDIDSFKVINDTHGHSAGDYILLAFTKKITELLRGIDTVGRLGGEEFAVLLPETDIGGAEITACRICRAVEEMKTAYGKKELTFTVSIGIAEFLEGRDTIDSLIKRADAALYRAKGAGKNQVCRG